MWCHIHLAKWIILVGPADRPLTLNKNAIKNSMVNVSVSITQVTHYIFLTGNDKLIAFLLTT